MTFLISGTGTATGGPITVPDAPNIPAAVTPIWTGIGAMTWYGWDGSRWPLLDIAAGAVLMNDGVRGLSMPRFNRHTSSSQSIAGTRWRGYSTDEREVFWPLAVYSDDGTYAWLAHNAALWGTFRPDRTGIWEVETSQGKRRLRCRFDEEKSDFDQDPSLSGWHVYGVTLVAEDPYWRGDPIAVTWHSQGMRRAFLPKAGERGFFLTSSWTAGSAKVSNPGDVDTYPVHTVIGPVNAGAKIGLAGSTVTLGFAVPAGSTVTIDTRPDRLTVTDEKGTNRLPDLTGDIGFPPIPAGDDVPLVVEFAGTGTVVTSYEPAYFRAF